LAEDYNGSSTCTSPLKMFLEKLITGVNEMQGVLENGL
jgi:hypothetical protein